MPTNNEILAAIPSTEPATFGEFLSTLPDCPEKGDRAGWRDLFSQLRTLENAGLVEVERTGGSIESLLLTEDGAARVRSATGYVRTRARTPNYPQSNNRRAEPDYDWSDDDFRCEHELF